MRNRTAHPLPRPTLLTLACAAIACACAAPARAGPLLITEVVTDPQADHSENSGGNGVAWDEFPGAGTISSVDEFVEIFNAGDVAIDLTGYTLVFADTTPAAYVFGGGGVSRLRFSAGGGVAGLPPGGFALLGNPPGALNNAITVELKTPGGALLDRWTIPDGNATSFRDEALARRWNGFVFEPGFERAPISPLWPGPPNVSAAPEPGSMALMMLSGLLLAVHAASRASGRTGRRGRSRRSRAAPLPPDGRVRTRTGAA